MNATEILEQLDPGQIQERLDAIDSERRALMTLMRAARKRDMDRPREPRRPPGDSGETVAQ